MGAGVAGASGRIGGSVVGAWWVVGAGVVGWVKGGVVGVVRVGLMVEESGEVTESTSTWLQM